MTKKYIETGKIVGSHGIRGEMKIQPWCDGPQFIVGFKKLYLDKDGQNVLKVKNARVHGNICLVLAEGIDTVEAAELYRGKTVYIDRADCCLEKGRYFIDDILGCRVIDADTKQIYGTVSDVSPTGANDVWHINNNGKEYLIPNIPQFVRNVDIEEGIIEITPIKGIFDDED